MQNNKETLLKSFQSESFRKRLALSCKIEKYTGGGTLKKLQRLIFTPKFYLSYILITKFGLLHKQSEQIKLFWDREINIPIQDYDSLALKIFGFASGNEVELKLTKFFIKNLTSRDIFYDIGGNYGYYTYLASELTQEVHTFEPVPVLANIIKSNIPKDKKVFVNQTAISSAIGQTDLYLSDSSGSNTINPSTLKSHSYVDFNPQNKLLVRTMTLDSYIKQRTPPTFIKIDVEGAEANVIRGSKELLMEHSPIIAMEVWGKGDGGEISMQAVNLLRELGYQSFSIASNGEISIVEGDLSAMARKEGGDNFIFKKR
jgi:FkbM family methyltransferase